MASERVTFSNRVTELLSIEGCARGCLERLAELSGGYLGGR